MLRQREETAIEPLTRELPADLDTPITAYLKLSGTGPSFLLESVSGGERLARFSFIGVEPRRMIAIYPGKLEIIDARTGSKQSRELAPGQDAFDLIREELAACRVKSLPGLPRFAGGLVGFIGYEMVRFCEPSLKLEPFAEIPDSLLLHADTLVVFDHAFGTMRLVAVPRQAGAEGIAEATERLDSLEARLSKPLSYSLSARKARSDAIPAPAYESNMTKDEYMEGVRKAKERIAAGDIFQLVLSQRLSRRTTARPFQIYRALRRLNPSPYMYYFDFAYMIGGEPLRIIGASPELHVRLEGERATLRPIAGTNPRGKTEEEDIALEKSLLADEKERAEHIMLVDLARNDLGRVCKYGSVEVAESFVIERYSHVMHIVSQVEGDLDPARGMDAIDLLKATFPAGTVSGAPKIKAMEIIDELEKGPRGPYAGVIGYLAGDGSMDSCITIRTILLRGDVASVQAAAGLVADSVPEKEWQESMNKARALLVAVDAAEREE